MKLKPGQQAFIELTNLIHGGEGWDLGEALWSPTLSRGGVDTWKTMREVNKGDIVIHSIATNSIRHRFYGLSQAISQHYIVEDEPLIPGIWSKDNGYSSYYKVDLANYENLEEPLFVREFLQANKEDLTRIKENSIETFYVKKIDNPAQKYLVKLDEETFDLIINYFTENNLIIPQFPEYDETKSSNSVGTKIPGRVTETVERIIRDTKIVKDLKIKYNNLCQICGTTITLPNGNNYSEGHHLKKLGSYHSGPDIKENIIILCPNHHIEFDYGSIAIDYKNSKIIHRDEKNIYHNRALAYDREDLDINFLKYHFKEIFNK